jgi:hypothetical protein
VPFAPNRSPTLSQAPTAKTQSKRMSPLTSQLSTFKRTLMCAASGAIRTFGKRRTRYCFVALLNRRDLRIAMNKRLRSCTG